MRKEELDDIALSLALTFEEAQNTLQLKQQIQITRFIKDPNWLQKQIGSRGKFKLELLKLANRELQRINNQYDEAFTTRLKSANTPMNQDALKRLEEIKKSNAAMMTSLSNQVYQAHQRYITQIGLQPGQVKEIAPLERTNFLYNQITKVLNSKEAQEEVRVVYRDGKKMPFKSYMEMNARTTLNQEVAKQQMEAAPNLGVVFWLCNSFENCRTQHIDYQGKTYYDDRWESYGYDEATNKQIRDVIAARGMVSRQSVENQEPYLGNCPNCRHEFIAIPIEDVIEMNDNQLLKDNNMFTGKATEEKYQVTQQQRLYERKIRENKFKVERNKELLENAPEGAKTQIQAEIAKYQARLDDNYSKIRELVKTHDYLERDYSRESVKILREDLGYRANHTSR